MPMPRTDYANSYAAAWRVRRIDPTLWLPVEEVAGVRGASVKRSWNRDGSCPLLESGDMEVTGRLSEGYYRIEMLADTGELVNVATLLFAPDGSSWSHRGWSGPLTGRSVLAPASERRFEPGEYAPRGVEGASWCARMLRSVIDAPVTVEGSFGLSDHVVFDLGLSYLDGVWRVLDAGGYCLQIAGDGTVVIRPVPADPALVVNSTSLGLLMPEFGQSLPIDTVPNVLKVYDGAQEAVARNEDSASPTSIPSRGRPIEGDVEDSPARREGETLRQYADRRLGELSEIYETIDVEREYAADVLPYSIVRANLPEAHVTGDYRIMDQTLECGRGIRVGETWGRMA